MPNIEGAILVEERDQIVQTEYFQDLDLLGVIKSTESGCFVSLLYERGDEVEVPTGGEKRVFWVEIFGIEAISGNIHDSQCHLRASAHNIKNA